MKDIPFSLSIDGSNDTRTEKMNLMTVKLFDVNCVQHRFLDMCTTAGSEAATAETIFNKMDSVADKACYSWKNFISLSVDNTSVNTRIRNSLRSRILIKHPQIYGCGCASITDH